MQWTIERQRALAEQGALIRDRQAKLKAGIAASDDDVERSRLAARTARTWSQLAHAQHKQVQDWRADYGQDTEHAELHRQVRIWVSKRSTP